MIDEEEKQKYCEASKCKDCTQWHKHCNAECCKIIVINIDIDKIDEAARYLHINPGKIGLSDIKYYANRDVDYVRGLLRFKKDRFSI